MLTGLLIGVPLAYLALVALAWAFQGSLIYPIPPVRTEAAPGFAPIEYTTQDGLTLSAGYRAPRGDRPTLLFFHGNGADWQTTEYVTRDLVGLGYGVLAAEYRGYGGNPGSPHEAGLYADARGAWDWLIAQGTSPEQIVIVGNSIGSGPATQLASEEEALALVLISPFASLEETAARKMRFLPVRLLLRDRYDNLAKFPAITEPVLILHGERDQLITLDQSQDLAVARDGVELEIYSNWGHDLVVHEGVQDRIAQFLQAVRSNRRR